MAKDQNLKNNPTQTQSKQLNEAPGRQSMLVRHKKLTLITAVSVFIIFLVGLVTVGASLLTKSDGQANEYRYDNAVQRVLLNGESLTVIDTTTILLEDDSFIDNITNIRNQLKDGGYNIVNDYTLAENGGDNCTIIQNSDFFITTARTQFCVVEVCNTTNSCVYLFSYMNRLNRKISFELVETKQEIDARLALLLNKPN